MTRNVITLLTDEGLALLRTKSVEVSFTTLSDGNRCLDKETYELVEDLKKFVVDHGGLGMSAIQLGVAKRIFVMRKDSGEIITIINPVLDEATTDWVVKSEGCFSIPLIPGVGANVARSNKIEVTFDTETGLRVKARFGDMEARIFQHEMDHLEGNLMIDKDKFTGWSSL